MTDSNTDDSTVESNGDRITATLEDTELEADWRTMKRLAEDILREAETHKTDLEKAEAISGAWVRVSCGCCDYEEEFEYARTVRERGQTPEAHADHPDFDCTPDDVTIEAFCPRHGTIRLAYDECDSCASNRALMNR
ncbi:hypothetical protein Htur_5085 (plasmid) [Haloterrigena turkmenica DSM 5511]|uniref:Uncharacterized protein n=1 Tax=Haloterrigena turkmenica (strain ATCC 51198 / DSM 5511 / JCM 9101 / NCIMB 13204 / VKM B-1734 / 4k) TaxID=543526 RepID=D2S3M5_HALTV|nr:hypothetical protein [Haloterrigena turkmenica]ADB63972.1 hypothetical protein Htur_5085 [Haloterrigena turkmenica DSM 5511]